MGTSKNEFRETEESSLKEQKNHEKEEVVYELVENELKPLTSIYGNNSFVMNHIVKLLPEEEYGNTQTLHPFKKRDGSVNKQISTYYTLTFTEEMKYSSRINEFDKAIADVFYTLKKNGRDKFTIDEVGRVFYGNPNHKLTPKQRQEIKDSVDKMTFARLEINCSDEMKIRTNGETLGFTGKSPFMSADLIQINVNGYEVEGFILERVPLIYKYAESVGQIVTTPIELLSSKRNNSSEVSLLKKAIIKRIELLKNNHNNMDISKIRYGGKTEEDGLFGEIGCYEGKYKSINVWKNKKNKLRKCVRETLDNCILNGYIASYEEYLGTDKKTISGVKITL
jgi:hypothetical protein